MINKVEHNLSAPDAVDVDVFLYENIKMSTSHIFFGL